MRRCCGCGFQNDIGVISGPAHLNVFALIKIDVEVPRDVQVRVAAGQRVLVGGVANIGRVASDPDVNLFGIA